MKVISRIKRVFTPELLRLIAAICDNQSIVSSAKKMIVLGNLLKDNHINYEVLGGATNRIALLIDGYAFKFAMDDQGYMDNQIEYSLSPELYPRVTKSYETNGYILVAECVEIMTEESWAVHKVDILSILQDMSNDYLLGDVGYIKKNMTNWGLRNGRPVILDYAYCHRKTEKLFTCGTCGEGTLVYDSTYDILMCNNKTVCNARYNYTQRKLIQGTEIDEETIKEAFTESVRMEKGVMEKEVISKDDQLLDDNAVIIDSPGANYRYKKLLEKIKEERAMYDDYDDATFDILVDIACGKATVDDLIAMEHNIGDSEECEYTRIPKPVYTDEYYEALDDYSVEELPRDLFEKESDDLFVPEQQPSENDEDDLTFDDLVDIAMGYKDKIKEMYEGDAEDTSDNNCESIYLNYTELQEQTINCQEIHDRISQQGCATILVNGTPILEGEEITIE